MEESNTESQRKLVSIQRVVKTYPIVGADFIEACTILGWNCIIKKDEIKENELCVFYEIDSFLPNIPMYEFLKKTVKYKGVEGYRLKTMKLKKVLSQGLALPFSAFSKDLQKQLQNLQEGDEVTKLLDVVKYDVAVVQSTSPVIGKQAVVFPSFIPKTDQIRLQSMPHYFDIYKDNWFEETFKLDGSSCTIYKVAYKPTIWETIKSYIGFMIPTDHFGVCSRNLEIKPPTDEKKPSQFWEAAIKYNIATNLPIGYALQGELVAPNIQSNHEKVKEVEYYVFDIYNITTQKYLTYQERANFLCTYLPNIQHVPTVGTKQIFQLCPTIEQLLQRVEGPSMNPGTTSEGRVYKCTTNPQITFKVINNKYLLKEK